MSDSLLPSILETLGLALGLPVRAVGALPDETGNAARRALAGEHAVTAFSDAGACYLAARYGAGPRAIVVLGPYQRAGEPAPDAALPVLDASREERATRALAAAGERDRKSVV